MPRPTVNAKTTRPWMRTTTALLAIFLLYQPTEPTAQETAAPSAELRTPSAGLTLTLEDLRGFSQALTLVRDNYVDAVDDRELLDGALRGLVAGLDDHSEIFDPRAYSNHQAQARGRVGGIGATLEVRDHRLYLSQVWTGGPAFRADIAVGDQLLAVDGHPVRGRPLRDSLEDLSGEPDTEVRLRVLRPGGKARTVRLRRALIEVPSVFARLAEPQVAYLEVTHFHEDTATEFEQALRDLEEQTTGAELRGVVIDLRGNAGGTIGAAIRIADGFLDEGLVVYTQGRSRDSRLRYEAQTGQWLPDVPVALIIDRESASAAEILAGALQDRGRAVLVGENSFGKGTVQSVVRLHNGYALKLTTARYYTPSGRSIEGQGIRPDRSVDLGAAADTPDPGLAAALASLDLEPKEG